MAVSAGWPSAEGSKIKVEGSLVFGISWFGDFEGFIWFDSV
jgi:hypothetical protein